MSDPKQEQVVKAGEQVKEASLALSQAAQKLYDLNPEEPDAMAILGITAVLASILQVPSRWEHTLSPLWQIMRQIAVREEPVLQEMKRVADAKIYRARSQVCSENGT